LAQRVQSERTMTEALEPIMRWNELVLVTVLGISGVLAVAQVPRAAQTDPTTITAVHASPAGAGNTFVTVDAPRLGCANNAFAILGTEPNHEQLVSLALAAQRSGRRVVVSYDAACTLHGIKML
jgi:hypothetical protein